MTNSKALQILFDTYWSKQGWRQTPVVIPEDYAYAVSQGYMFEPMSLSHDKVCDWLIHSYQAVQIQDVANAFLASLSTRRLDWRSALGSYAIARYFPGHSFASDRHPHICSICGWIGRSEKEVDLSVLNFERFKWGGANHAHPEYAAFDLEQFSKLDKPTPSKKDIHLFEEILSVAKESRHEDSPRDLEKRLAGIFKSNQSEREVLIQILSYCGILQPRNHPGYFHGFVDHYDRTAPPVPKNNWTYPIRWWSGADGINQQALEYYFAEIVT